MAVLKETMDVFQIPFRIRELSKKEGYIDDGRRKAPGYDTFTVKIKMVHARSMTVEMTSYRSWRQKGKLLCLGTDTEECTHPAFASQAQLDVHQRARKHGPYAIKEAITA